MKLIVNDKKDKWTSCELRRMVQIMRKRSEQELQLDYFDDEMTEHLEEQLHHNVSSVQK